MKEWKKIEWKWRLIKDGMEKKTDKKWNEKDWWKNEWKRNEVGWLVGWVFMAYQPFKVI